MSTASQFRPCIFAPIFGLSACGGAEPGLEAEAEDQAAVSGPVPTFQNPVVPFDCPDPGVLEVAGSPTAYYLVCTGGGFRIHTSTDLVTWVDSGVDLLPGGVAPWAQDGGRNWAPEMHATRDGYVAYYTASARDGRLAIGAARAPTPLGPWTHAENPLMRGDPGVIDATRFADGDRQYLYWKIDGNAVGRETPILARELAADGVSFVPGSVDHLVLTNDRRTWEGGVVEAPWVVKRGDFYYLIYSGNVYDERYATAVARSSSKLGPFIKRGPPILGNSAEWVGPGHGSVVSVEERDYFFHHAWPTRDGRRDGAAGRNNLVTPLDWVDGWPTVAGGISAQGEILVP